MSAALVEVVLSAYDGERWIAEQVDSVLAQQGVRVHLTVRDDGSRDGTAQVLAGYAARPDVTVRQGQNLGLPAAFFRLIDESRAEADFLALCDQDDVWEPGKLARAVAALEPVSGPAMYCARVLVVDQRLDPLYPHELPWRGPSFANALVQNIALGCTVVLNRAARELLLGRWPRECVMHDAWIYLVLAGTGTVLYDPQLVVRYRQHGGNSVGMGRGPVSRLAGRVRRQLSADRPGKHGRQDRELQRLFEADLTPAALRELRQFLDSRDSVLPRLSYALTGPAHRQTQGSDVVLKTLQAMGRV